MNNLSVPMVSSTHTACPVLVARPLIASAIVTLGPYMHTSAATWEGGREGERDGEEVRERKRGSRMKRKEVRQRVRETERGREKSTHGTASLTA
jgi:hypothetical protein